MKTQVEEIKEHFRERFGRCTFCDNCGYVLSEREEEMLDWLIKEVTIYANRPLSLFEKD